MPFGFCRDCTYCRCYGRTVHQVMKEEKTSDVPDWRWHCLRHAPINHLLLPQNREVGDADLTFWELFPKLRGVDVLDKAIGCGEFELDPNALLDEYEQQQ